MSNVKRVKKKQNKLKIKSKKAEKLLKNYY